jgi:hypothetical protein
MFTFGPIDPTHGTQEAIASCIIKNISAKVQKTKTTKATPYRMCTIDLLDANSNIIMKNKSAIVWEKSFAKGIFKEGEESALTIRYNPTADAAKRERKIIFSLAEFAAGGDVSEDELAMLGIVAGVASVA